ncbi:MAG: hypothetical protein MI824_05830 [Hyphomicrobiales bacterium]|nr:hypothetical protein [Hyphomicrobiales bacterium]
MVGRSRRTDGGKSAKSRDAASEINRQVGPLIDIARTAQLDFVAYLLDMVSQETDRVSKLSAGNKRSDR